MFKYTIAAFNIVKEEISRAAYVAEIILQLFFTLYPIYSIATDRGFLPVNIAIALISLAYLVLIVYVGRDSEKNAKKAKKKGKMLYKRTKIAVNAVGLGITFYNIVFVAANVTPVSLILAVAMLVGWVVSVALQLISVYISSRVDLFRDAVIEDLGFVADVGHEAGNIIRRIKGEKPEEKSEMPEKSRRRLEIQIHKDGEKRAEKKRQRKENSLFRRIADKAATRVKKNREKKAKRNLPEKPAPEAIEAPKEPVDKT